MSPSILNRMAANLVVVPFLFFLLFSPPALAGTFDVFGPQDYTRSTGSPVTVTKSFTVPNLNTTYTLQINNGGLIDGDYEKVSSSTFVLNGVQIVGPNEFNQNVGTLTKSVTLSSSNQLSVTVLGKTGGGLTIQIMGVDNSLPTISASVSPAANAAGWNNSNVTVTFTCSDAISGVATCPNPVTVSSEGVNQVISGMAVDKAGNSATASVTLNIDKAPPALNLMSPTVGLVTTAPTVVVTGSVSDALSSVSQVTINGAPASLNNGTFSVTQTLTAGSNTITIAAADLAGNTTSMTRTVSYLAAPPTNPPPDPSTVAPPLSKTAATSFSIATQFLYSGSTPIQFGVAPGTIVPRRAAVLRGRVFDNIGQPLSGVLIAILNHPELGLTLSRTDGRFDIAVNGGGPLIVTYKKSGYPSVQRQVNVPWQNYAITPDVFMIPLDPQSSHINLTTYCDANMNCTSAPMQVAQGSRITDSNGTRQATLLFPSGVTAVFTKGDGSTATLNDFHVHATEYTVGPNGPKAMPAALPPASGYTYEVEFNVEEAEAAGATRVSFSQPLISYTENFLGFPVGSIVPSGDYDRQKGIWIPAPNGLVIQILSISNGAATLDLDGSGQPADSSALAALGIGPEEVQNLAQLYQSGQSLWRVPIDHFLAIK